MKQLLDKLSPVFLVIGMGGYISFWTWKMAANGDWLAWVWPILAVIVSVLLISVLTVGNRQRERHPRS